MYEDLINRAMQKINNQEDASLKTIILQISKLFFLDI